MTALVENADMLRTRVFSVGSANRAKCAKCAKSAKCDPGWVGSGFLLLGLRTVRIVRTVLCLFFWLVPQFAHFARQTGTAAVGAEFAQFAVFAELVAGIGGTSE